MPSTRFEQRIRFYFLKKGFTLKKRKPLKKTIVQLFQTRRKNLGSLNYIFCSDEYLLELNKNQLKHDYYTDILTFPLSALGEPIVADIYISIDRVRENAKTFGTTLTEELPRVIFHGALHLCGYKDKSKTQTKKMRSMENKWLTHYLKRVPRETRTVSGW